MKSPTFDGDDDECGCFEAESCSETVDRNAIKVRCIEMNIVRVLGILALGDEVSLLGR